MGCKARGFAIHKFAEYTALPEESFELESKPLISKLKFSRSSLQVARIFTKPACKLTSDMRKLCDGYERRIYGVCEFIKDIITENTRLTTNTT